MKKLIVMILGIAFVCAAATGCGDKATTKPATGGGTTGGAGK